MNTETDITDHSVAEYLSPRFLTYFVNGERQSTEQHELRVHTILSHAGFTPPSEYQLIRDQGNHSYANEDDEVHLHEEERFTALFKGPTPTS